MPLQFMYKCQYLCRRINKVEWSGVLFYELKGTINAPDKMEIILKDIFLMDVGSQTYTEYSFDEEVVGYMMDNKLMYPIMMGHIHSHNIMDTFFSGTDLDELRDNSANYNFYFSLIVNNVLDCTAKVAFRGMAEANDVIAKNEKGKPYVIKKAAPAKEQLFTYDCIINYPTEIPKTFNERAEEVIVAYNKRQTEKTKQQQQQQQTQKPLVQVGFQQPAKKSWNSPEMASWNNIGGSAIGDELFEMPDDKYYDFTAFLLRLGNVVTNGQGTDSVEDALEDIELTSVDKAAMSFALVDKFVEYHGKFFNGNEPEAESAEFIMNTLTNVIIILEENEEDFVWLTKAILGLRSFGNHLSASLTK